MTGGEVAGGGWKRGLSKRLHDPSVSAGGREEEDGEGEKMLKCSAWDCAVSSTGDGAEAAAVTSRAAVSIVCCVVRVVGATTPTVAGVEASDDNAL